MEENKRTCMVKYIPASPCATFSETAKHELMKQVPCSRLTTDKAMRKYLAKVFDMPRAEFEEDPFEILKGITKNPEYLAEENRHRVVSDSGIVYPGYEDKLRSEGFELIPSARSKGNLQVKDFKKYLFDFEKECTLTKGELKKYQINLSSLDDLLKRNVTGTKSENAAEK